MALHKEGLTETELNMLQMQAKAPETSYSEIQITKIMHYNSSPNFIAPSLQ